MDLSVALLEIYKNTVNKDELCNPCFLYSRLADMCSDSFKSKENARLFYQIDERIGLFCSAIKGKTDFSADYEKVSDIVNGKSFCSLVRVVCRVVDPNFEIAKETPAHQVKTAPVHAVIVKAPESESVKTRTPLNTSAAYSASLSSGMGCLAAMGIVGGAILFTLLALIFDFNWTAWQWIIGIVGGLLLGAIAVFFIAGLHDEVIVDFYVLGTVILGIFGAINFTLQCILSSEYQIIFSCISVIELFLGFFLVIMTFDECEEGWGIGQIVECLAILALLIIGVSCF